MLKVLILFAFSTYCAGQSDKLPKGIQVCLRKDAGFATCLGRAIEGALLFFKDGNDLFKLPPLDPYHVDYIEAAHSGGTSNFNLKSMIKNANVTGLSLPKVVRVATKFDKKFGLKAEVKGNLKVYGDYTMSGQIVVLPIKGDGKANMTLTEITTLVDLRGDFFDKNGQTYINITKFTLKLTPKYAKYYFENIFNGEPVLSKTINNFMNDNSELVSNTLLPGYSEKLGEKFIVVANQIFHNVPVKMIFPE